MESLGNNKGITFAAGSILAAAALCGFLKSRKYKKRLEKAKKAEKRLARENIALLDLACDELGISRGWENHILPIDSAEVQKLRVCKSVNEAERSLYQALVCFLSRYDEDECSLFGIHGILTGVYVINQDTPFDAQLSNAKMNVKLVRQIDCHEVEAILKDYTDDTLVKGAVLLENDVYYTILRLTESDGGDEIEIQGEDTTPHSPEDKEGRTAEKKPAGRRKRKAEGEKE